MNLEDAKVGSAQRAGKMALEALKIPALALAAAGLPGYALAFVAHMVSGNGYSVTETLSSALSDPLRRLPAYALGIVGAVAMAPMFPYAFIKGKVSEMQRRQSDRARDQKERCVALFESGSIEELGELLAGMSFRGSSPLKDKALENVSRALFESAFERDDTQALGALLTLNGGGLSIRCQGREDQPLIFKAARANAINSVRNLLDAGADPTLRSGGEFAEEMASSRPLKKMLQTARGDRVKGILRSKALPGY